MQYCTVLKVFTGKTSIFLCILITHSYLTFTHSLRLFHMNIPMAHLHPMIINRISLKVKNQFAISHFTSSSFQHKRPLNPPSSPFTFGHFSFSSLLYNSWRQQSRAVSGSCSRTATCWSTGSGNWRNTWRNSRNLIRTSDSGSPRNLHQASPSVSCRDL